MQDFYSYIDEAKHAVVHDYPGGAVKLAPLVQMNPGTLSNKVNPAIDTHHLTVDEMLSITAVTKDFRLLQAINFTFGMLVVDVPPNADESSDMELLDLFATWVSENGETANEIKTALADGKVDAKELKRIRKEVMDSFQSLGNLYARMIMLGGGA